MFAYYAYSVHPIFVILLVLLLVGFLPAWPYSRNWGYPPVFIIIMLMLLLLLFGCETVNGHRQLSATGQAIVADAETIAKDAAVAAATTYGGPLAGELASAGLSALAQVLQGYVGTTVPATIVKASPGITGVGSSVLKLMDTAKPVTQQDVNKLSVAADLAKK